MSEKTRNTVIVNLYAGPGAGKTTCAWIIAAELKKRGVVAEYVPEYAKELVWDKRFDLLDGSYKNQLALFAEQNRRLERLVGQVDAVITDSPLLLGAMYAKERRDEVAGKILEQYHKYRNFNLFINRGESYENAGRIHDLEESRRIDKEILQFLKENNIYYGTYYHKTVSVVVNNIQKHFERLEHSPSRMKEHTAPRLTNEQIPPIRKSEQTFSAWISATESKRYRWVEDEIYRLNGRGAMYYTGGEDGVYMRISNDGKLEAGRYEGAIPHIGEALFHTAVVRQFGSFADAYKAAMETGGRQFLIDMFSGGKVPQPLHETARSAPDDKPSVMKQIREAQSAPKPPAKDAPELGRKKTEPEL